MGIHKIEHPGRRVIRTRDGQKIVMEWNPLFATIWRGRYERAQIFLDGQVLYKSEPYIPIRYGELIQSGRRFTRLGSGVVKWRAGNPTGGSGSYARPVYYGRTRPGRKGPKVTRSFKWFERMKGVSGEGLVKQAKRIAGGGNG